MSAIINIVMLILSKFGMTESVAASGKKPSYIYMKRVIFCAAFFLCAWALIDPESLAIRLERASEIMPAWFTNVLSIFFMGLW